jgi:hypothetical protein
VAKWITDTALDALLGVIKGDNRTMTACSAQPTTRTQAITTYALADVALSTGDFTLADGAVNGRKITVAEKANVPIDVSGTATYVAICDASNLLAVTTCTSQALVSGNTVTFPAWIIAASDPT